MLLYWSKISFLSSKVLQSFDWKLTTLLQNALRFVTLTTVRVYGESSRSRSTEIILIHNKLNKIRNHPFVCFIYIYWKFYPILNIKSKMLTLWSWTMCELDNFKPVVQSSDNASSIWNIKQLPLKISDNISRPINCSCSIFVQTMFNLGAIYQTEEHKGILPLKKKE